MEEGTISRWRKVEEDRQSDVKRQHWDDKEREEVVDKCVDGSGKEEE